MSGRFRRMFSRVSNVSEKDLSKIGRSPYVKLSLAQPKDTSIIRLARTNPHYQEILYRFSREDYIYYHQVGSVCSFVKREHVKDMWHQVKAGRYSEYKSIIYNLCPPVQKLNTGKNLLVIFSSMPPGPDYDSPSLGKRCFVQNFSTIQKFLIKNTYVLRVADINCVLGSHYVNTINNPKYENNISNLISKIISDLQIEKNDVVLYGASKGGTGALIQAAALDLNCVSVDPILDLKEYIHDENDLHLLAGMRPECILDKIKIKTSNTEKYLILSERIPFNYSRSIQVKNVKHINLTYPSIVTHPDVSKESVAIQTTLINSVFLKRMLFKNNADSRY